MGPGFWNLLLEGMLGALILELIKIAAWQDSAKIAARFSDVTYWIGTGAVFILAGLVVAVMNVGHPISLLQAAQLGINAPAIASGWASARTARKQPRGRGGFIGGVAQQSHVGTIDRLAQVLAW
jgi:hypothetical protein